MGCESCGERPKHMSKDFTKAVIEINNPETLVLFRKVSLPASMGTEEETPASIGKYRNVLLVYEANGHIYLYSSDGIPTLLSTDIGDLDEIKEALHEVTAGLAEEIDVREAADSLLSSRVDALSSSLSAETMARETADTRIETTVNGLVDALADEITNRENVDTALGGRITSIEEKIPNQATPQNQLADKAFVNSSIATNTANYISDNGQPFTSLADLKAYSGPLTNNDYAFVVGTDQAGNTTYTRYKYVGETSSWAEEYVLNNSSFTAVQWAAINSNITSGSVEKLVGLANIKTIGANLTLSADGELSGVDTNTTYTAGNAITIVAPDNNRIDAAIYPADFFTASGIVSGEGTNVQLNNTFSTGLSGIRLLGNTAQPIAPSPDSPQDIDVATGGQSIEISDGASQSQSYTVNLGGLELCALDGHQDHIYKGNNGWYLHKEIGTITLTGSAPESWVVTSTYTDNVRFTENYSVLNKDNNNVLSNYFTQAPAGHDVTGIDVNAATGHPMLTIPKTLASTVGELTTWLSSHNTLVYYVLPTPTDTRITDAILTSQLNALANGTSYDGETHLTVTALGSDLPVRLRGEAYAESLDGVEGAIRAKQNKLTAGEGINITDNVISATYTGPNVVQTTGTSTTDVMSQNAISSMIFADPTTARKVAIGAQSGMTPNGYSTSVGYDSLAGDYAVAIGGAASAATRTSGIGSYSIAIGNNAKSGQFWGIAIGASSSINTAGAIALGYSTTANGAYAVAIGAKSTTSIKGEVSFGGSALIGDGYNNSQYRLLTNVYDPQNAHDAANKGYVDTSVSAIGAGTRRASSSGWNTSAPLDYIQASDNATGGSSARGTMFYVGKDVSDIYEYVGVGAVADQPDAPYWLWGNMISNGTFTGYPSSARLALLSDVPSTFTTNEWNALWA